MQNNAYDIPSPVLEVLDTLRKNNFESFLVGGCVRDLLLHKKPKDWDITTNATPDQIISIFENTTYENRFGTVMVHVKYVSRDTLVTQETFTVEVTPYRTEKAYTDNRHPNEVVFSKDIHDDLKRRDFTINAMALDPYKGHIIDDYNGQKDLKDKIIRTVGNPFDRFSEDALRLLRAIRFSTVLDFSIAHETAEALLSKASEISLISEERIRDEFVKIIESDAPMLGIELLRRYNLLQYVIPELLEGVGCEQKGEHVYDVYHHLLHALGHAAQKKFSTEVRIAALLHDIGKPRTRAYDKKKDKYTFFGHEVIGAHMTKEILYRLKFPKETVSFIKTLVRNHMFFSDTEQISLSAVRRIIKNVGENHIWELMHVRECDRVGMKKKETPYRLRKYFSMIEQVLRDPVSVQQLIINGEILKQQGITPGPRMGWILHALLEEVLEDPKKNTLIYLQERARILNSEPDAVLKTLGEAGKNAQAQKESLELAAIEKRYGLTR